MRLKQAPLHFTLKDLYRYCTDSMIMAREIHDQAVIPLLGQLSGRVLELGAGGNDYSVYATNCDEYIRSDYQPSADGRIRVNALNIPFKEDSFDGIVCMSAMEHIEKYQQVFWEIHRVLKPGGKLILNTPWLFPFHGAPNDYFRFSPTALNNILDLDYEFETFEAVGNFWLSQAMFLQRPKWSRIDSNRKNGLYDRFLRLIGTAFILKGARESRGAGEDDNYALLYNILATKKETARAEG